MILERTEWNNGYGCSCCRQDWENSEWTDESDMRSFEEIIDEAFSSPLEDIVGRRYERDGKIIYGFESRIFRMGSDVYILKGDSKIQITRICQPLMTKEEFISKFLEVV